MDDLSFEEAVEEFMAAHDMTKAEVIAELTKFEGEEE